MSSDWVPQTELDPPGRLGELEQWRIYGEGMAVAWRNAEGRAKAAEAKLSKVEALLDEASKAPEARVHGPRRISIRLIRAALADTATESQIVEDAWDYYTHGSPIPRDLAASIWDLFNALGAEDERIDKIVRLGRLLDSEAHRGTRCSVCAGVEGSHDDC